MVSKAAPLITGVLFAQLVNIGTFGIRPWGWRLSLGLAAIPGSILLLGGILLPDSPNSLIERGQFAKGREVLERIRGTGQVEEEYSTILAAQEVACSRYNIFNCLIPQSGHAVAPVVWPVCFPSALSMCFTQNIVCLVSSPAWETFCILEATLHAKVVGKLGKCLHGLHRHTFCSPSNNASAPAIHLNTNNMACNTAYYFLPASCFLPASTTFLFCIYCQTFAFCYKLKQIAFLSVSAQMLDVNIWLGWLLPNQACHGCITVSNPVSICCSRAACAWHAAVSGREAQRQSLDCHLQPRIQGTAGTGHCHALFPDGHRHQCSGLLLPAAVWRHRVLWGGCKGGSDCICCHRYCTGAHLLIELSSFVCSVLLHRSLCSL